MRVLQVINSLAIGGAERLIVDTTPLGDPSIKTEVLLINKTDSPFEKELMDKDVNIYYLNKKIYNPLLIYDIIRYVRKYDIIHAHLFPTLYLVGFAKLLSFSKTKLIFTEHSTTNRRRSHSLLNKTDKFIYSIYNKLICISPKVRQSLFRYLGRDDIITINNGVDLSKFDDLSDFEIRNELGLNDAKIIIQVANFKKSKDQFTTIKSMVLLPEEYHLILVGDGELKSQCQNLAQELKISHRIHFLGKRSDIPDLLLTADVVVVSSNWEGFGLAAVEGMAAKKPVVASNVEGLDDVVENAGILFERGSEIELSSIIERLCTDESYYNTIAQKCYNQSFEYDINNMKRGLIKVYSECFM